MRESVKPPQVVFGRPKSAGPVRGRPQLSSPLAPALQVKESKPSTPLSVSISIAASAPPRPIRPLNNKARRPSSAIGPRRCFTATSASALPLPKTAREAGDLDTILWQQDSLASGSFPEENIANIYHAVVARKDAEDAAEQLARRIAHFRAQEERVLHEMQTMRTHLETTFTKTHEQAHQELDSVPAAYLALHLRGRHKITLNPSSRPNIKQTRMPTTSERTLKVPRSREQLEFLARQKRALEVHRLEVARHQREQRKQALAEQKVKQAEQERRRRCRNERIRAEEQQVLEQRREKQRQMHETVSKQQYERLMAEKQRQHEALSMVAEMEEEERNLRLRLEALQFHREYMQQELRGSLPLH